MLRRLAPILCALTLLACTKAETPSREDSAAPSVEAAATAKVEAATEAADRPAAKDTDSATGAGDVPSAGQPAHGNAAAGEDKAAPAAGAAAPADPKAEGGQPPAAPKEERREGNELAADAATGGVAQGQSCTGDKQCAGGLECIEYYGFAGPAGPRFASCEIRCKSSMNCPKGQTCTTIADGPGQVCR